MMDYFLTEENKESEGVSIYILHKKNCPKMKVNDRGMIYVGYYFGEYGAVKEATSRAEGRVILCPYCFDCA